MTQNKSNNLIAIRLKPIDSELFKTNDWFDYVIYASNMHNLAPPEIFSSSCGKYWIRIPGTSYYSNLVTISDFDHECFKVFDKIYTDIYGPLK